MNDDRPLVEKVLQGDKQAFITLIQQNQRLVAHMVGRVIKNEEDRQEVCQDVFLKVYDKLGEFNYKSRLSTWIGTIAFRLSINYLKKKRIKIDKDLDELSARETEFVKNAPEQVQRLQDLDHQAVIKKAVDQLPVHYKLVITLFHLEEKSHAEIGEIMDMPIGTVKNYIFRARKLLKEYLELRITKEELL